MEGELYKRILISVAPELAKQIKAAARAEARGNVSAWVAEAARERVRLRAMKLALDAYEAEHGKITDEEMAEVDRKWSEG